MKHKIEVDEYGRITNSWTIFGGIDHAPDIGFEVDERIDIETYCWDLDKNEKKLKKKMDLKINKKDVIADGEDTIIITDLPNPTSIYIDGQILVVEDGTFEFTLDAPGKHKMKIITGLDLPEEIEINAS